MVQAMSELNFGDSFWYGPDLSDVEGIFKNNSYIPNLLEEIGNSEAIVRQADPTLNQFMGRLVYLRVIPTEVDTQWWSVDAMSALDRFLEPTRVVGMAPSQEYPRYLVAPLPLEFITQEGKAFLSDHIQARVLSPQNLIDTQAIDFGDITTCVEVPVRIIGRELWGYEAGIPIY